MIVESLVKNFEVTERSGGVVGEDQTRPIVTSIAPPAGDMAGGEQVVISGQRSEEHTSELQSR